MPAVNLLFWQYVKKLQIRQFRCEIVAKNVIARAQRSIFDVNQDFAFKKIPPRRDFSKSYARTDRLVVRFERGAQDITQRGA